MKLIRPPKISSELEILPFELTDKAIYVNFHGNIQAGFPSPADDFKEPKMSLDRKYITHPDSTYIIRVSGDSMYPTLHKGDILIVRADLELINNKIAIISINNSEYTVKRYNQSKNTFIADNKNYPDVLVKKDDIVVCLGIVKHLIRDL